MTSRIRNALDRIHRNQPCYFDGGVIRSRHNHEAVRMWEGTFIELTEGGYITEDGKTRNVVITPKGWSALNGPERREENRQYYKKRKDRGEVQVTVWIREEDRERLMEFVKGLRG